MEHSSWPFTNVVSPAVSTSANNVGGRGRPPHTSIGIFEVGGGPGFVADDPFGNAEQIYSDILVIWLEASAAQVSKKTRRVGQPARTARRNAATDGPGYRATPRSTTEPHRGWMSDTYLLHLHAEGEKCFLLTSPFIEPALGLL